MGQGYTINEKTFGCPIFEAIQLASMEFADEKFRVVTARGKDLGYYKRID